MRGAAHIAPSLVAIAVLALLAAPIGLYRAGSAVSIALGVALGDTATASGFVATVVLGGAAVGALVVVVVPGRRAFGPLVAVSPASPLSIVVAGSVVPLAVVSVPATLGAAALLAPALARAPGGAWGMAALAVAFLAGVALGVAVAECALQLWRGRLAAVLVVAVVCVAWLACGTIGARSLLGPSAAAGSALAGTGGVGRSLLLSTAFIGIAVILWAALAQRRPSPQCRARRHTLVRVRGTAHPAVAIAVWAVLTRRPDLRRAIGAAGVFGVGGLLLARSLGLEEPLPVHLGIGTVVLAAAAFPVAVAGALLEGRTTWVPAPARRVVPWAAACVGIGAVVVASAPVLLTGSIEGDFAALGAIALAVILTAAMALVAGAAAPLRRERVADQIVSFGAFLACAGVAGLGVSQVGARLSAAGAPDSLVAVALAATFVGSAGLALSRRLERG